MYSACSNNFIKFVNNYFEYFALEPRYHIDSNVLRKLFYKKSMTLHPDHADATDSIEATSLNNEAYRILSDPHLRLKHLLELEYGTLSDDAQSLTQDFLMDMMEINEEIEENRNDVELLVEIESKIKNLIDRELLAAEVALNLYDTGNRSDDILTQIKLFYYKEKYFRRMMQNLHQEGVEI